MVFRCHFSSAGLIAKVTFLLKRELKRLNIFNRHFSNFENTTLATSKSMFRPLVNSVDFVYIRRNLQELPDFGKPGLPNNGGGNEPQRQSLSCKGSSKICKRVKANCLQSKQRILRKKSTTLTKKRRNDKFRLNSLETIIFPQDSFTVKIPSHLLL